MLLGDMVFSMAIEMCGRKVFERKMVWKLESQEIGCS